MWQPPFPLFLTVFTKVLWHPYQCAIILVDNKAAIACSMLRRMFFPLCGSVWGERGCQCQPCSGSPLPHAGLGTRAQRQSTGVNSGTQWDVALGQQTLLSSQGKLQNSRMVWFGKDIKDHPVPTPCHGQWQNPQLPSQQCWALLCQALQTQPSKMGGKLSLETFLSW